MFFEKMLYFKNDSYDLKQFVAANKKQFANDYEK